jgi:hypothetical protein
MLMLDGQSYCLESVDALDPDRLDRVEAAFRAGEVVSNIVEAEQTAGSVVVVEAHLVSQRRNQRFPPEAISCWNVRRIPNKGDRAAVLLLGRDSEAPEPHRLISTLPLL